MSLVVQADTADAANHALRQVLRRTRGELALRWMREGFNTLDQASVTGTAPARNLMGFKDGTANPATADPEAMDAHVWIQADDGSRTGRRAGRSRPSGSSACRSSSGTAPASASRSA